MGQGDALARVRPSTPTTRTANSSRASCCQNRLLAASVTAWIPLRLASRRRRRPCLARRPSILRLPVRRRRVPVCRRRRSSLRPPRSLPRRPFLLKVWSPTPPHHPPKEPGPRPSDGSVHEPPRPRPRRHDRSEDEHLVQVLRRLDGFSSSSEAISLRPIFSCTRFIHRGAHQQSLPSSFMTDGTRNIRTTVASSSSAVMRPIARYCIITRSEKANAPPTTTSTSAAALMRRPVVAVPVANRLLGGHAARAGLDHAGHQEDLVVGRQAEDHRDDQSDHRRRQRGRREVEQARRHARRRISTSARPVLNRASARSSARP